MATDIPRAREKLREATDVLRDIGTLESAEALRLIVGALSMMKRQQKHVNRRTIAKKVTPAIITEVLAILDKQPYLTDVEVGGMVGINGGRVSEIKNGLRTVEKPSTSKDGYNRELADLKEGIL